MLGMYYPMRDRVFDEERACLAEVAEAVGQNLLSTTGAQRKNARAVSAVRAQNKVVEAAGIEPASVFKRKERWRATSVAAVRFSAESVAPMSPLESPTVPWSPPQSWRHFGDGP